jgi:energy-converting hydrogenase A subunit M
MWREKRMTPKVAQYTLRIMGETDDEEITLVWLGDLMSDIEEQISSRLPEGFYCKIDEDHLRKLTQLSEEFEGGYK